ncbi:helix-turn-helix domain-containing protein [Enterococcus sp. HY326]|uniref:helix-turn-helix domain-containing protein n=1 Tax=Enterococcus sp. HY326 TaxID=2971265 RepID=UPI00223FF465|nr:helix-turn-helix transcriptional regulator [Enterococcus sp. HY326]
MADNVLGQNIKRLRNMRGLTQDQLAKKVGVRYNSIQNYEGGVLTPKGNRLALLSEALEVTPELLKGELFQRNGVVQYKEFLWFTERYQKDTILLRKYLLENVHQMNNELLLQVVETAYRKALK